MVVELAFKVGDTTDFAWSFWILKPIKIAAIKAMIVNPISGLYLIQAKANTSKKLRDPAIKAIITAANPTIQLRSPPIRGIQESNVIIGEKSK